jgi:asparagine synthase (glutamine-hydrolysing)
MPRYLSLRWTPANAASGKRAEQLAQRLESKPNWTRVLKWRGIIVLGFAENDPDWDAGPGQYSVVFGSLFRRDDASPAPISLDVSESLAAAETEGQTLIDRFFGGYVAFLINHAHDHVHIVRDPTCAVACWSTVVDGVHVIFSDARDYAAIGGALEVDETRVAAFLLQPRLSMRRAGLAGVEELHGGECLTLGRTFVRRKVLWRPHLEHGPAIADFETAKREMRNAVLQCVNAWSSGRRRVALKLSGGLDWTLVLHCLAAQAPELDIVCANLFSPAAPEGDERFFASAAAANVGKPLVAIETLPEHVDYARVLDAPLFPAPVRSCLDWSNRKLLDNIVALNADVLMSGQGGDHVFHRNRTPLIAADAAREGLRLNQWGAVAIDTAHVSGQSVWTIAAASLRHGWARRPLDLYALWRRDRRLVANADWSLLWEFAEHPWLQGWSKLPAGQAQRLALLLDAEHYNDPNLLKTRLECVAPLYAQPIIELTMRIPPRLMTYGGRDRALIRAAFASELPDLILKRSTKGETTRYFAAVIGRNRAVLADILMNGKLRARGLLNVAAVEAALKLDATSNEGVNDLLICLAAEAWLCAVDRESRNAVAAAA